MLEWHETAEALGPPAAGPFRMSKEGTRRRHEAQATILVVLFAACGFFVLSGYAADGAPGAVLGIAAAVLCAIFSRRLVGAHFARVVPSIEVHERGICFCDAKRPVLFEELDGVLVSPESLFLAFKKGQDPAASRAGDPRPWWERAVRRRAYWEVPLEGFADPAAVVRAVREVSHLPVTELNEEVAGALRSRAAQAIARVPAAPVEFRF